MKRRLETRADISAIQQVTDAAFAGQPYSDGSEASIVTALRNADALSLSLVAEVEGQLVAHVAFSRVDIAGVHDWYGLGPVSVLPALQRGGIGQALIRDGLARLQDMGANGCVLVGSPDYYHRFGFENNTGLSYADLDQIYVQRLVFHGPAPEGAIKYHAAFAGS